jgi:hypothetical protein
MNIQIRGESGITFSGTVGAAPSAALLSAGLNERVELGGIGAWSA